MRVQSRAISAELNRSPMSATPSLANKAAPPKSIRCARNHTFRNRSQRCSSWRRREPTSLHQRFATRPLGDLTVPEICGDLHPRYLRLCSVHQPSPTEQRPTSRPGFPGPTPIWPPSVAAAPGARSRPAPSRARTALLQRRVPKVERMLLSAGLIGNICVAIHSCDREFPCQPAKVPMDQSPVRICYNCDCYGGSFFANQARCIRSGKLVDGAARDCPNFCPDRSRYGEAEPHLGPKLPE